MARNYQVGYRKPPKATRFKPGRSGNSNGRPRGSRNFKTDLEEELREVIAVSEHGRRRHLSKQRILIKTWMAKALQGDHRAFAILVNLALRLIDPAAPPIATDTLTTNDRTIIERFLGRQKTRVGASRDGD